MNKANVYLVAATTIISVLFTFDSVLAAEISTIVSPSPSRFVTVPSNARELCGNLLARIAQNGEELEDLFSAICLITHNNSYQGIDTVKKYLGLSSLDSIRTDLPGRRDSRTTHIRAFLRMLEDAAVTKEDWALADFMVRADEMNSEIQSQLFHYNHGYKKLPNGDQLFTSIFEGQLLSVISDSIHRFRRSAPQRIDMHKHQRNA